MVRRVVISCGGGGVGVNMIGDGAFGNGGLGGWNCCCCCFCCYFLLFFPRASSWPFPGFFFEAIYFETTCSQHLLHRNKSSSHRRTWLVAEEIPPLNALLRAHNFLCRRRLKMLRHYMKTATPNLGHCLGDIHFPFLCFIFRVNQWPPDIRPVVYVWGHLRRHCDLIGINGLGLCVKISFWNIHTRNTTALFKWISTFQPMFPAWTRIRFASGFTWTSNDL